MKPITEWLQKATSIPSELYGRLITTLICILVLWLFRWLILKRVWKRTENSRTRYQWRKISNYVAFTFAFTLIGRVSSPEKDHAAATVAIPVCRFGV